MNFFGTESSLGGGGTIFVWVGTRSHLGGHGPGMPPRGAGSDVLSAMKYSLLTLAAVVSKIKFMQLGDFDKFLQMFVVYQC